MIANVHNASFGLVNVHFGPVRSLHAISVCGHEFVVTASRDAFARVSLSTADAACPVDMFPPTRDLVQTENPIVTAGVFIASECLRMAYLDGEGKVGVASVPISLFDAILAETTPVAEPKPTEQDAKMDPVNEAERVSESESDDKSGDESEKERDEDVEMDSDEEALMADLLERKKDTPKVSVAPATWTHPVVRPNQTLMRNGTQILAWDASVGMLVGRRASEGAPLVLEVEMHDRRAFRPLRIVLDETNHPDNEAGEFVSAGLCPSGVLVQFAKECRLIPLKRAMIDDGEQQMFTQEWTAKTKTCVASAISRSHVFAVIKDGVRFTLMQMTITGVPVSSWAIAADSLISLCCFEATAAVCVQNTDRFAVHLFSPSRMATLPDVSFGLQCQLQWMGMNGTVLALYDSAGNLLVHALDSPSGWIPMLAGCRCWPVGIQATFLDAFVPASDSADTHPDPYPNPPTISQVPFEMPCMHTSSLFDEAEEGGSLSVTLQAQLLPAAIAGLSEREHSRMAKQADRHLLQLIQCDEPERVYQLASLAMMPKTVQLASQLAEAAGLAVLASRLQHFKSPVVANKENRPTESALDQSAVHKKRLYAQFQEKIAVRKSEEHRSASLFTTAEDDDGEVVSKRVKVEEETQVIEDNKASARIGDFHGLFAKLRKQ